ncbi:MAG: exbD 5 [Firmicutes bacterium]|jgi:biopolymer transport protein ExbD|nr:exbD 5 [Bacillota bacterium]
MKLRNLRTNRSPKLMIIPMIDIIFFLLVFFMMSTLYMIEQHIIPINLPYAASEKVQTESSISATVLPSGKILFENEEVALAEFGQRAKIELSKNKDIVFVLRADQQAEYGKVVAALDELKLAGVSKIAIATERKDK